MKFVLNDQIVLSRAPEGPLGHYIASFSEWVWGKGGGFAGKMRRCWHSSWIFCVIGA